MSKSDFASAWQSIKKLWHEFWSDPSKKRDFRSGLLILVSYVVFNFLRGLFENWIFSDHSLFTYSTAKILSTISYWIGSASWLLLLFLILNFFFKKHKPYVTYGIFGGCLIILLIFLSGIAAIFRIFFRAF